MVDGHHQPLFVEAVFLRDQVPGKFDGVSLEVVAEREVAEHFEERVVAGGIADVVEVIVLAPGPHAFLRGGRPDIGPGFLPGEHVLELHHARVGEHEGRIVARHQRTRCDGLVTVLFEIVEKRSADFVDAGHVFSRPRGDGR